MQASSLKAYELFCRRGDRLLFGSLDMAFDGGDALHLVGPNGIGKSSLMQILAGLRRPSPTLLGIPGVATSGIVTWQGTVGLLDERLALDGHLSLERALAFWRQVDGGAATVPLEMLGLSDLLEVPVRYLSTGQRKRAALARLFVQGAANWLLDEPLNGLDASGVAVVENAIAERRAAGGIVVVASHQPITMPGAATIDLRDNPT